MRIMLGTVQFGMDYGIANQSGKVSDSELNKILNISQANGIDMLDTAINYGDSEARLGTYNISNYKIITKLPGVKNNDIYLNDWVNLQVNTSLKRLNVNSIYGLLLHRPEQLMESWGNNLFQILKELKETGLVKKIGVSIYSTDELEDLTNKFSFDVVQLPLSIFDRRFEKSGWLKKLKDKDTEIHSRSTFLQGLLLMPKNKIPKKFLRWSELWSSWFNWLSLENISALQACVSFPLSIEEVDRVVVGVDNSNQLNEIIKLANSNNKFNFPDFSCQSEELLNPKSWSNL